MEMEPMATHEHVPALGPHTGHTMQDSHDRHAGHSVAMFREKFWLSFALTVPIVVWSPDVQHWFGYTVPTFPGSQFLPAILGSIVFLYGGIVFVRGARSELSDRLGNIVAFTASLASTFGVLDVDVW